MSNSLSPPRRKPKPQAENWDDDFEFSLPSVASSSKKGSTESRSSTSYNDVSSSTLKGKGKEKERDEYVPKPERGNSPTEDWDEDWDESPPKIKPRSTNTSTGTNMKGLSSPTSTRHERKKSSIPPPLAIPPPYPVRQHQPRWSPSHTASLPTPATLPLPTSSSSQLHQPLLPSRSHSSLGLAAQEDPLIQSHPHPRSRSGSTTAGTVTRNKLIKRHPSTSFVPIPSRSASSSYNLPSSTFFPNESDASLSSLSFINHDSPNLPHPPVPPIPRSKSGEQMPPPPLPIGSNAGIGLGLSRSRSRSKSKAGQSGRQQETVRVSGIPFSPSRDNMAEQLPKKPGFWKRLSGAPTVDRGKQIVNKPFICEVPGKTLIR
ncbi:hypothetical protein I317_04404 [Kwoniella heveanensis CBS 569]|nr:hypothetical protein I317_04404 [Kwoniella heveanensis CBS 569]